MGEAECIRRRNGLLSAIGMGGCGSAEPAATANGLPATLHLGIIPNISPEKQRAQYEPLRAYLAGKLGVQVDLFVATDYAGVVTALVAKKIDIAYLGGLTYAQAKAQATGVTPMITEVDLETGTEKYLSAIVVRKESAFTSTKDVVAAGARSRSATSPPPPAACIRASCSPTPAASATASTSPSARR